MLTKTNGYQTQTTEQVNWNSVARIMLTSRQLDELEENELTPKSKVRYQFSARGHELGQAILSQMLGEPNDAASVYYRCRPLMLGIGLTVKEALLGSLALSGSPNDGRDFGVVFQMPPRKNVTVLPNAADTGSQFTPATGWAHAIKLKGQAQQSALCVAYSGDGATSEGGFWAAINIAATERLPVLFVIDDNGYAISTRSIRQTPRGSVAANLASFADLKICEGDGTDAPSALAALNEAVAHVRSGDGPALVRLQVPRLSGHSSADQASYKPADEVAAERARDPLPKLRRYLIEHLLMSAAEWDALEAEIQQDIRDALLEAETHPTTDVSAPRRFTFYEEGQVQKVGGLLANGIRPRIGSEHINVTDGRRLTSVEAIRRTLDLELSLNDRMLIFGEDVAVKGGVHAVTLGLQSKHGESRVFDTSLNEEGIIGRAVGLACAGMLPVPEIQFRKYADACFEQINNIGTIRWRTNNTIATPMVVRMAGGFRKVGDIWHSVTSESTYAHMTGWRVAMPSNAEDAVGLLRTALRGNDPVIFFEHRYTYDAAWSRRPYPGDDYMLPFGRGKLITRGDRLSVITWGAMVEICEAAAEAVGGVEVIDLRTIVPWDKALVLESVRKTSKCLIVHEDIQTGGFGGEIAATLADEAFFDLDAPIMRVAAPDCPVPFSAELMQHVVPTRARIQAAMEKLKNL